MAKIRHSVKLHPETVAKAQEVAKVVKRKRSISRKPKTVTVSSIKVDTRVLEKALELAGGDYSRLTIERDGSVIVWNNPRTTKPQDNK